MNAPVPSPLVLCVDDEILLLQCLARLLRREGARVLTALDGRAALGMLASPAACPDLVLTDLCMPDVDGEALLSAIRRDPRLAAVPVVAVSGLPTEAPFDGYLPKPFCAEEVRELVRRFGAGLTDS